MKAAKMNAAKQIAIWGILAIAVAAPSEAQNSRSSGQPGRGASNSAVELLQSIEQQHGQVQSVAGSFSQTLSAKSGDKAFSGLQKGGNTSPATFKLLKPNNFRVEYGGIDPSTQLITGQKSYTYVPKLKQVTTYEFKNQASIRDLNYLLLGFGAKTEDVLRVYSVKSLDANKIQLIPRNKSEGNFNSIIMEVTADNRLLPRRFIMEQNDGSRLTVNMDTDNLRTGAQLSQADFQPDFPKDKKTAWVNQQ